MQKGCTKNIEFLDLRWFRSYTVRPAFTDPSCNASAYTFYNANAKTEKRQNSGNETARVLQRLQYDW